jgi:stress response protein YsnF
MVAGELAAKIRRRDTVSVRIRKTVRRDVVSVDESQCCEGWGIERVPADQIVDVAPAPRWDGDTLILPVVEEVLVKQLRVVEEVRITRRRTIERTSRPVPLRREEITVRREEQSRRDDAPPVANAHQINGEFEGAVNRRQI